MKLISRRDAENRLTILVNEIEGIFADIRERNVDDSVCGLCEYDCDHGIDGSAFECLGFERDDCFKLKDKCREEWTNIKDLPSAQQWIPCSERLPEKNGYYLTTTYYTQVYADYWNEDHFDRTEAVIAWMPLPEPYNAVDYI